MLANDFGFSNFNGIMMFRVLRTQILIIIVVTILVIIIVNFIVDNIKITRFTGIFRWLLVLQVPPSPLVIKLRPSHFTHRYKQENLNDLFLLIRCHFLAIIFELNIYNLFSWISSGLFNIFFLLFLIFHFLENGCLGYHGVLLIWICHFLRRHIFWLNLWILILGILWNIFDIYLLLLYVLGHFWLAKHYSMIFFI